ncbi:MAG: MBL fold metallo-hydrolase [Planctomycetes bacterium]|nr:MBL fold metallo-hydrolase [Planctomycetota bacterium]
MNIHDFVLGELETNGYVLTCDQDDGKCLIIDSGLENSKLINYLKERNLTPEAIILTHGHADHIVGVRDLRKNFPDISVVIHKNDAEMLTNPMTNLSALTGISFTTAPADIILEGEQKISFAGIELEVLETPGHTPGGISLYNSDDNVVFSGDTLFAGSVGRSDFPGGNHSQLINSIKEKLLTLPQTTKVYPGHGYMTTISLEKDGNPFLK